MKSHEILVHISAPSGVRDDARYRAQVEAILGFQSQSRQLITLTSDDRRRSDGAPDTWQSTSPDLPVDADPREGSKRIQPFFATNSHCTIPDEAVLEERSNAASSAAVHEGLSNATTGSKAPTTKDSTVLPDPDADSGHQVTPASLLPQPQNAHAVKDSLESPVSVIPDSQPEAIRSHAEGLLRLVPHVAVGSPRAKRHCSALSPMLQAVAPNSESVILASKLNEERPKNYDLNDPHPVFQTSPQPNPETLPQVCLDRLPLAIKPSLPPVSKEQFVTHVTPTLAMLARRLKPARTYKPVKQSRDLEQLERGHWYLRINILLPERARHIGTAGLHQDEARNWDLASFSRFWSFLSDFISKDGRAGWGVWCILEDAPESLSSGSTDSQIMPHGTTAPIMSDQKTNLHSFVRPVILKLYAWGEIALHMYLLLFLASERRIRKMGAQWRDGRDEVVIEMP